MAKFIYSHDSNGMWSAYNEADVFILTTNAQTSRFGALVMAQESPKKLKIVSPA